MRLNVDMTMTKHFKYGGSTAARTLTCPAWHFLSKDLPRSPSSPAAELGTALHTIIEKCTLDTDLDPYDFAGKVINNVEITIDHIEEKIYPALDAFEQLMDDHDVDLYWCELFMQYGEEVGGTGDFIGLSSDLKTFVAADYKSGDGVIVDAEENAQNLFYSMCAMAEPELIESLKKVEKIVIAIVQPTHRSDDVLSVWETTPARVEKFASEHAEAVLIASTADENTTPVVSDYCKFCPAEALCPAKKELVLQSQGLPVGGKLVTELAEALKIVDAVEAWAKAVKKMAYENLEKGVPVEGYKLVNKRASRVWTNEADVLKKIHNHRKLTVAATHNKDLKSPAQLEKVCKSAGINFNRFADNIACISSGTTLAKATDKRQGVLTSDAAKTIAARFA